jgi:hypothetical protein
VSGAAAVAGPGQGRAPAFRGLISGPDALLWNLEAPTLVAYFLRDMTAGATRYYLAMLRLEALWFIPDLMAAICLVAFVRRTVVRGNNAAALLTLTYLALALFVGFVVLGTVAAAASSFKMMLPVFVGFCFTGRLIGSYRRMLVAVHAMFYASVAAVLISSVQVMPWVGFRLESFGAVREAGRLWWAGDSERLSGFAADSTMSSFFIMITFVMTAPRRSWIWVAVFGPIGLYTAYLTTNKTSTGVIALYMLAWAGVRLVPMARRFAAIRLLGLGSFAAVAIPVLLIGVLAGVDLEGVNPILFSMQDRINNSWQLPFAHMLRFSPTGYFIGCGLGCFNYPQELFSPKLLQYWVPVDNFYLGTYFMLGLPFLFFLYFAVKSLARSGDVYRYNLAFAMNIFTVTILSYGPASGLLTMGIILSDIFSASDERGPSVLALRPAAA